MKKNLGQRDRLIRFAIAIILFGIAYWKGSWIALLFGLFTIMEARISWCVLYQIFGINTCPIKKK